MPRGNKVLTAVVLHRYKRRFFANAFFFVRDVSLRLSHSKIDLLTYTCGGGIAHKRAIWRGRGGIPPDLRHILIAPHNVVADTREKDMSARTEKMRGLNALSWYDIISLLHNKVCTVSVYAALDLEGAKEVDE